MASASSGGSIGFVAIILLLSSFVVVPQFGWGNLFAIFLAVYVMGVCVNGIAAGSRQVARQSKRKRK